MDKLADNPSTAHRAGHLLGSIIRRYLGFERAMTLHLLGKGMNPVLCQWVFLISKLGLIALWLYLAFWVALAVFAVWVFQAVVQLGLFSSAPNTEEDEGWEHGLSGFGYYMDGHRVDPGRCDDE
jgi:hypothetical protein